MAAKPLGGGWGRRFRLPADSFTPSEGADAQSLVTLCITPGTPPVEVVPLGVTRLNEGVSQPGLSGQRRRETGSGKRSRARGWRLRPDTGDKRRDREAPESFAVAHLRVRRWRQPSAGEELRRKKLAPQVKQRPFRVQETLANRLILTALLKCLSSAIIECGVAH